MNHSTDPETPGRLPAQRRTHRPVRRQVHPHDALDVTLHDDELSVETELTALLMVAVNDAADTDEATPLPQHEVDRLLGVRP